MLYMYVLFRERVLVNSAGTGKVCDPVSCGRVRAAHGQMFVMNVLANNVLARPLRRRLTLLVY
jgi:drug/metabolite transporter superfamily protein YnfA